MAKTTTKTKQPELYLARNMFGGSGYYVTSGVPVVDSVWRDSFQNEELWLCSAAVHRLLGVNLKPREYCRLSIRLGEVCRVGA